MLGERELRSLPYTCKCSVRSPPSCFAAPSAHRPHAQRRLMQDSPLQDSYLAKENLPSPLPRCL